jgi:citrate lyase gamma subunit
MTTNTPIVTDEQYMRSSRNYYKEHIEDSKDILTAQDVREMQVRVQYKEAYNYIYRNIMKKIIFAAIKN